MNRSLIWVVALAFIVSGCGSDNSSSTGQEDTSPSGSAAAVVGGALGNSSSSGTLASNGNSRSFVHSTAVAKISNLLNFLPEALANIACPTYKNANGSGCTSNSTSKAWYTYDFCSFGSSTAEWKGTQAVILSAGTASCGYLPYPSGSNKSVIYQFVTQAASSTPSTATRTNEFGSLATVDDASPNLAKFDPASPAITPLANGGYGTKVNVATSGGRSSVQIARRIFGSLYDHSITGTVTLADAPPIAGTGAGSTISAQLINGTLTIYHNSLQVIGTSTFSNVVHTDNCCLPVRGTITTAFTAGPSIPPTSDGALLVGKSETLTLTGCGTGTIQKTDGSSSKVSLSNCF